MALADCGLLESPAAQPPRAALLRLNSLATDLASMGHRFIAISVRV